MVAHAFLKQTLIPKQRCSLWLSSTSALPLWNEAYMSGSKISWSANRQLSQQKLTTYLPYQQQVWTQKIYRNYKTWLYPSNSLSFHWGTEAHKTNKTLSVIWRVWLALKQYISIDWAMTLLGVEQPFRRCHTWDLSCMSDMYIMMDNSSKIIVMK